MFFISDNANEYTVQKTGVKKRWYLFKHKKIKNIPCSWNQCTFYIATVHFHDVKKRVIAYESHKRHFFRNTQYLEKKFASDMCMQYSVAYLAQASRDDGYKNFESQI